jgi:hypothetical protein
MKSAALRLIEARRDWALERAEEEALKGVFALAQGFALAHTDPAGAMEEFTRAGLHAAAAAGFEEAAKGYTAFLEEQA